MGNWIDHLVFAAPSLAVGIDHIHNLTGTAPVFGGRHEGAGTHNALMSLGSPTYLEVLAPDPDQATPSPLLGPDTLKAPVLQGFAVGCHDLDQVVAELRDAGIDKVSDPLPMSRRTADGTELTWRLAFISGPFAGAHPFLISWGDTPSPASTSPIGGRLVGVRAGDPDPEASHRTLAVLGIDLTIEQSATPWLRASIETPIGPAELY